MYIWISNILNCIVFQGMSILLKKAHKNKNKAKGHTATREIQRLKSRSTANAADSASFFTMVTWVAKGLSCACTNRH